MRWRRYGTAGLLAATLVVGLATALPAAWATEDPPPAGALGYIIPPSCLSTQAFDAAGKPRAGEACGLAEMVEVAVRLSRVLLGLLGSVTLVVFIYGGVVWLTAAGNTQRVEQGKKVFEGALVGLAIALGSYAIINFAAATLTGTPTGQPVQLFQEERPGGGGAGKPPFELPAGP